MWPTRTSGLGQAGRRTGRKERERAHRRDIGLKATRIGTLRSESENAWDSSLKPGPVLSAGDPLGKNSVFGPSTFSRLSLGGRY